MVFKTEDKAWIKNGHGYYDTTAYPLGGCFRRATRPIAVVVKEAIDRSANGAHGCDFLVRLDRPEMASGTAGISADGLEPRQ